MTEQQSFYFAPHQILKLEKYRNAVQAGFYTDQLRPDEPPYEVELAELLPLPTPTPPASMVTQFDHGMS